MILLPCIAWISAALLLSLGKAPAQTALPSQPATCDMPSQAGTGTEPVPGKIPGTRRYNVTFKTRTWGLEELRQAITAKVSTAVDAIVRDREIRARQDYEPFCKAIDELGGRVVIQFWLINACTVEIRPADVARVQAMANVLEVQPDLPVFPDGYVIGPGQPVPMTKTSTNAANHNSDYVHQTLGIKGTGFSIAYIDTGQDSNMAAVGRPHMTYFRNGSITTTNGGGIGGSLLLANVAIPGTAGADDLHGNGTSRCGIAAGSGWNTPNAGLGHAFDAGRVGYSICVNAGSCGATLAIQAAGWQQAAADKVRYNIAVAGMGYTGSTNMTDVSQMAIDSCALVADILPCTPASSSISSSSATANGLAAASATPNVKTIATFSVRGPMGARTFPDIAANGVNIVTPLRDNESGDRILNTPSEAQVVGVALLVKAARPGSDAREIKALLLATSEDVPGYTPNTAGQGYLRADLACDAAIAEKVRSGALTSTGTPDVHRIAVTSSQPVKLALTWFRHIVTSTNYSDLNLVVKNGTTVVASSASAANLYEVVSFTAPLTGILNVEVSAASLEVPSLPYALASTHSFVGGTPGTYATSGAGTGTGGGCAGTSGIPALSVTGHPILGKSFSVDLTFAPPSSYAVLFLGFSNTSWNAIPLPLDLGPFGAPGCFLRVSGNLLGVIGTSTTGTGSLAFAIPRDVSLLGGTFWNQLLVNDSGANALRFTTSNSGRGSIGDL